MLTIKAISNQFKKPVLQYVLLTILLFVLALYFNVFSLLISSPIGTHIWRQADSASFAWSYWQNGLDFFHPQIMNRTFGNGYALSEFPFLQYISAILFTLFGFHWFILKGVYFAVFLGGIFALFNITSRFIVDKFWAFFLASIFFSAPTLIFYGTSPIPDVAALSLSFIGISFYFSFKEKDKNSILYWSMLAFCLSGLLKITYLLPFIAILIIEGFLLLFSSNKKIPKNKISVYLFSTAILFFVIGFWWWLMKSYNALNNESYFLTNINPYWNAEVDAKTKGYIFKRCYSEWALRFFHPSIHYLFFISIFISLFHWKKVNKYIFSCVVLLLLGSVIYYMLWYIQFLVHDYYTIPFYVVYFFSLLNLCVLLNKIKANNFIAYTIKFAAVIILIMNAIHVKKDFHARIKEASLYNIVNVLSHQDAQKYIRKIGISSNDKIIVIPDDSPQISLNYLGNPGFTEFGLGHYDINQVEKLKKKEAKYLLVLDKSIYSELIHEMGSPDWVYKSIFIYRL